MEMFAGNIGNGHFHIRVSFNWNCKAQSRGRETTIELVSR